MTAHGDLCLFCVEKIIPYSVSSNLGREGSFGSDITPPPPLSFMKLCDILQVAITDELLKGFEEHSSFVDTTNTDGGGKSCEKFLCLNCFDTVEKLSKLYLQLELIKEKIENGTSSIRDLIIEKSGYGLAKKREKKKKSSSLEFIEVFQKLVKESADSNSTNYASEVHPSPTPGNHANCISLDATFTSKPNKRRSSRKKRVILVQADEDEQHIDEDEQQFDEDKDEQDYDEDDEQYDEDDEQYDEDDEQYDEVDEQYDELGQQYDEDEQQYRDDAIQYNDDKQQCDDDEQKYDEDEQEKDDNNDNTFQSDVKMEVEQEGGFDDTSDSLPNEDTTTETDEYGQGTVTHEGSSRTQMKSEDNDCDIEQKFVPFPETQNMKEGTRKRENAEQRSPPKTKRKCVIGQGREFKCHVCSTTFQSKSEYDSHRKSHAPLSSKSLDITTIYKDGSQTQIEARICPICDKRINGKKGLLRFMEHTLSHEISLETLTNPTLYSCDKCEKKFFIKLNLDLHNICEHDRQRTAQKCDICRDLSLPYKTREDLIAHLKTHKEDTSIHLCKSCPVVCTTLDNLLNHMKKHAISKRLNCPECDHFVAPTLKELYYHCQKAHPELKQTFECEFCNKSFLRPESLKSHMRRECQRDGAGFLCDHCSNGKIYKSKSLLQRHMEYMHGDDDSKPFKCDKCPKCFKYKHLLQHHIDKKHDKIRYPCPVCAKSYCNKNQLNYHIKTHTGEDLFTCDVCGQQFPSMHQLKDHSVRVHSEKTEEVCDVCGKVFGNPLNLRTHKYTHKEKNLECEHCDMKFRLPGHLKVHLRSHTGEYPHICPICQKGFNRRDMTIVHLGVHGYSKEEAGKVYKQHEENRSK